MREQQTRREREWYYFLRGNRPSRGAASIGGHADGRRTDVRMWLYDTLDRSRRTRAHGRAEKKMEWKKKCCFARTPARPLGETVETRGDRAMIEEERREVGLSASEERLPVSTFLPSFTHIPTPINLPPYPVPNPTSRTQTPSLHSHK